MMDGWKLWKKSAKYEDIKYAKSAFVVRGYFLKVKGNL